MYPDNNFTHLHLLHMVSGIYDPERMTSPRRRLFLKIYNYIMLSICLLYSYPCEIIYVFKSMDELYNFLNNIGILMSITLGVFKWILMLKFRKYFYLILEQIENPYYQYEDYKDYKPGELMFRCRKISTILIVLFSIAGCLVSFTKYFVFVEDYYKDGYLIGTGNVTCAKMLPYYDTMPFEIETPRRCLVAFLLQLVPITFYVGPIIGFDLTFNIVAIYSRGQFLNIRDGFRTMRERCVARLGLPENHEVLRDSDNPKLEREIKEECRKLTVHLQEIIGIAGKMETYCKYAILGQMLTSLFALVTCLYVTSKEKLFSGNFVAQVQYALSINIELFAYCFLGSEISAVSSDVSNGIYAANWYSCTKSVKLTLLINLLRLQKPVFYTIGEFSPLSLNTFVSILKGSYSYYTFLDRT